jgi:hypothetical protein
MTSYSSCHLQPIGIHNNGAAAAMTTNKMYTPIPNLAIPAQKGVVAEGGSRAVIFTRIEAIYI